MKIPFLLKKKFLGIDIGTFAIKVVELSSFGKNPKLENYGQITAKAVLKDSFRTFSEKGLNLANQVIFEALQMLFKEANFEAKKAFISIPDFATFFATTWLPSMTKEELSGAISAEAKRIIPVPLGETIWDWQIIEKEKVGKKERIKILIVAVPKEIVTQYELIAKQLGVEILQFEAETFSLVRALAKKEEGPIAILEIGEKSTSCTIAENGMLKLSYSFDISGDDFTEKIAKSLEIDYNLAEKMKITYGVKKTNLPEARVTREIIVSLLETLFSQVFQVLEKFSFSYQKKVEKIILAGKISTLPGFLEFAKEYFKIEVEMANPFKRIQYPSFLEKKLTQIGPTFAIAVGLALRGFE